MPVSHEMEECTSFSNIDIWAKQRHILIEAINTYLKWRENKSAPDDRGYPVTIFTWLRHLTSFGEGRAKRLKDTLSVPGEKAPLKLLQEHFQQDSRIENHSLDTYLLESLLNHKRLFLISNEFLELRTKISREALRHFILQQQIYSIAQHAHEIALQYVAAPLTPSNQQVAIAYYCFAANHNHLEAYAALTHLATTGVSEAQYALGAAYYHPKHQLTEAINWCLKASEQQHIGAIEYISETEFNGELCFYIAKKYENGTDVTTDFMKALTYYKKSASMKNVDAAKYLGALYQSPDLKIITQPDLQESFKYYAIAADQKDFIAFQAMHIIAKQLNDNQLRFRLAQIQLDAFNDYLPALEGFKYLADNKMEQAVLKLNQLAKNHSQYAYQLAQLHNEDSEKRNLRTVCIFYIMAIQNRAHSEYKQLAAEKLEDILRADLLSSEDLVFLGSLCHNDRSAQINRDYALARQYYEKACQKGSALGHYFLGTLHHYAQGTVKNLIIATQCYQLAVDKGYTPAKTTLDRLLNSDELSTSELIAIASMYYAGTDGITVNWSVACTLYQKASKQGDSAASLFLGQFYQLAHEGIPQDLTLAFQYYLKAAKQGCAEALIPLERLAEGASGKHLLALSKVYATFFHRTEKATYWHEKAVEVNQFNM